MNPLICAGALLGALALHATAQDSSERPPSLVERLAAKKLEVSFAGTPMRACIAFVAKNTGVNIVVEPDVDAEEPIDLAGSLSGEQALRWICRLGGADFAEISGVVVVGEPQALAARRAIFTTIDVRDLCTTPVDFSAFSLLPAEPSTSALFDDDAPVGIDVDTLVDLIVMQVAPASWDEEYASLDARRGLLLIGNTPEVIAEVHELLDRLRMLRLRELRVEMFALGLEVDVWRERLATEGRDSRSVLSSEEMEKLLAAGDGVMTLARAEGMARSGQRIVLEMLEETTIISDLDVEIASGSAAIDPILAILREGASAQVRATATSDASEMILDLWLQLAVVEEMNAAAYGPADSRASDVQLDLPVLGGYTARTAVRVPAGGGVALTAGMPGFESEELLRFVFVVRVSATSGEGR